MKAPGNPKFFIGASGAEDYNVLSDFLSLPEKTQKDAIDTKIKSDVMRDRIVAEALSWNGTPWRHEQAVKGHGVDCAQFMRSTYVNCGAEIKPIEHYPSDWHLHRGEERFLNMVSEYCDEIDESELEPGDIMLWRWGRCYSHGGIYLGNRQVIHAVMDEGRVRVGCIDEGELSWKNAHPRRCFRFKGF